MKAKEQKTGWIRTMLNQILFVWAYWFCMFLVFIFWNENVFQFDFERVKGVEPWIGEALSITIPFSWVAFALGLTPFLVGAVWCRHNRFYQKMTRNSVLVKIMWGIVLIQSVLVVVNGLFAFFSHDGIVLHKCPRIFSMLIPFLLWFFFYFQHFRAVRDVARQKRESYADWRDRVGAETVVEVECAQMPMVSFSVAGLIALFALTV